jgi:MarR family transcriptional regulator, transcriptional regulator for hemolysin
VPRRAQAPAVDLSFLLNQASYALAARLGAALAEVGISVREYCVLMKAAEEERSQIAIAELAGLDKTTMVVTLDALERAGLAERRVSVSDRRARVVAVTPAGREVLGRAYAVVGKVTDTVLGQLDPARRDALVEALEALTAGVLATPSHTAPQRRRQVRAAAGA